MKEKRLSHITDEGDPEMVDVGGKVITSRKAVARAVVELGEEIMNEIRSQELQTKKGPVFQVAKLAGIMGAKKTSDLIPLCHPLGLNKVSVDVKVISPSAISIECTAKVSGKTGVEMEALTGASIAALTVYDMCKAMSHEITISDVKLIHKSGGKSDYNYEEA